MRCGVVGKGGRTGIRLGRQHEEGAFRVVADGRTRGRPAGRRIARSSLAWPSDSEEGELRKGRCTRLLRVLKRPASFVLIDDSLA